MGGQSVVELRCKCKNDPWGKKGEDSLAARLCFKQPGTDWKIDSNQTYSEMWMGTYPSVPSYVVGTGETLEEYLNKNPNLVGEKIVKKFGGGLPFLPKILSIDKALPLQIHPDRNLAEQLHKQDPDKFTDTNHKPEIAVALSQFELFAGWKPLNDLTQLFRTTPLKKFLPTPDSHFNDETLKMIAQNILEADEKTVADTIRELTKLPEIFRVDNGTLFAAVCMNYLILQYGESVYVPADGMHAYISGNIMECMARSDNVLNTGFCPRADRDNVALFCEAFTGWPHDPDEARLGRHPSNKGLNGKTEEYAPPISEFNVLATHLKAGEREKISPIDGPSILCVTSGEGKMTAKASEGKSYKLSEGSVFFVACGVELEFEATGEKLDVFRPYAE
ncbi:mannose-6-phosphate isomerase, class I [Talaromyces stipitatus ATCC 10500]|uniref:Mannose-6-phosphate isomerase n=1 Tax=Talaromyces stipitatus (strain ATCC 10500 / CBS 375.48 / QM 6759 / NRRL 1006) TaxID=441959 RepID=B8MHT9_TALSN|nr:mannose-6-phosphate isomerase, class I [Talaromyces stipitatus ATCC 10500]EED16419.1 mannose-6-phosphate isomerase, class I [Talaromyces stipitatus ATCC 10500]